MTDNGRSYVLERLKSKRTTIEDFNFDKLTAPPLCMFFTPYDIQRLFEIATSVSLSSKPKEKFKQINDIMTSRGMRKFGSGTNRVVYCHPEFDDIVFKVAYDYVAMRDNKAEFQNQFILKPFVTKVFEVDPSGVIAVVEKAKPIKNREEFLSVADDIFELINTWIIGKYVMADIGEKFFMNYAVRKGMGVILCDYPYLYELDGDKLFCAAPNPMNPSGRCDGVIDYDDGFNFLICKKCGCKYKANELAKHLESKTIIQRSCEGGYKMNLRVKGGSGPAKSIVINDNDIVEATTMSNVSVPKIPTVKTVNGANVSTKNTVIKGSNMREILDNMNKAKEDEMVVPVVHKKEPKKVTIPVEEKKEDIPVVKKVEAPKKEEEPVQPIVVEEKMIKDVKNAISFEENLVPEIKEADMNATPVMDIEAKFAEVLEMLKAIDITSTRDKMIFNLIKALYNDDPAESLKAFASIMDKIIDDFEDEESYKKALKEADIFNKIYNSNFDKIVTVNKIFPSSVSISGYQADITIDHYYDIDVSMNKVNDVEPIHTEHLEYLEVKDASSIGSSTPAKIKDKSFEGISFYPGKLVNIKEIILGSKPAKILAVMDGNSNYLTDDDNNIIAIDTVDNIEINKSELVSSTWLQNTLAELEYVNANGDDENVQGAMEYMEATENAEEAEEDTEIEVASTQESDEEIYDRMNQFVEDISKE